MMDINMGLKKEILLLLVLLLANFVSSAQQRGDERAVLRVDTNTFFHIAGETQLVTPVSISIQSSITGAGKLKIIGENTIHIDANGKTIDNLCINKNEKSKLTFSSDIHIRQSLDIQSGTIVLIDFHIFLNDNASIQIGQLAHIQHLGNGNIIRTLPPQLLVNTTTEFQLKQLFLSKIETTFYVHSKRLLRTEKRIKIDSFNFKPPTRPA
jgi:hypothetical protein